MDNRNAKRTDASGIEAPVCCLKLYIPTQGGFLCCPHKLVRFTISRGLFISESGALYIAQNPVDSGL